MKVKCIKTGIPGDGWWYSLKGKMITTGYLWWKKKTAPIVKGPKYDDILTVDHDFWDEGQKFYVFSEWPTSGGYSSTCFVPMEEKYEHVTFKETIKEKAPSLN